MRARVGFGGTHFLGVSVRVWQKALTSSKGSVIILFKGKALLKAGEVDAPLVPQPGEGGKCLILGHCILGGTALSCLN